jgi:hypothetical protein
MHTDPGPDGQTITHYPGSFEDVRRMLSPDTAWLHLGLSGRLVERVRDNQAMARQTAAHIVYGLMRVAVAPAGYCVEPEPFDDGVLLTVFGRPQAGWQPIPESSADSFVTTDPETGRQTITPEGEAFGETWRAWEAWKQKAAPPHIEAVARIFATACRPWRRSRHREGNGRWFRSGGPIS